MSDHVAIHRLRVFPVLFFFLVPLLSGDSGYPVNKIAFLEDTAYKEGVPPDFLIIGIDVEEESFYKIIKDKTIVLGGRLKKGLNRIKFPCDSIIKTRGAHHYIFRLKCGERTVTREMSLTVKMEAPEFKLLKAPPPRGIFRVSIGVGERTLFSAQKESPIPIVFKGMSKRIAAVQAEPPLPGVNIPLDALFKKAPPEYEYIPILKKDFPVDYFNAKGKRYTIITTVELKISFVKAESE